MQLMVQRDLFYGLGDIPYTNCLEESIELLSSTKVEISITLSLAEYSKSMRPNFTEDR